MQLLRLILAYVLGGLSFRSTAAWAEAIGQASMSDVAILKRARQSGPWLRQLAGTLASLQSPASVAGGGPRIVAVDATMICSPGDKQDYAVLHTAYDVTAQCFLETDLTDRHTAGPARMPDQAALHSTYCPHLNPIERLWGQMHKAVTHNRCHARFADFKDALLDFLRTEVPRTWRTLCDHVSDNFRIITAEDFRVMA